MMPPHQCLRQPVLEAGNGEELMREMIKLDDAHSLNGPMEKSFLKMFDRDVDFAIGRAVDGRRLRLA